MLLSNTGIRPTPDELIKAEDWLLQKLQARSVLWCGRGASALCVAYRIASLVNDRCERPEVILPATGCASLASTALTSGFVPRFADVDQTTGMPDVTRIHSVLGPNARAVLFVHLFGTAVDLGPLKTWASDKKLLLIEDIAHALGAVNDAGVAAGAQGDMAICSFSHSKIINCGGGALVIRSSECEELLQQAIASLPPAILPDWKLIDSLQSEYAGHQVQFIASARNGGPTGQTQVHTELLGEKFDRLWMWPLVDGSRLGNQLSQLPEILTERISKARIYASRLNGGPWRLLDGWQQSGSCWRFSLVLNESTLQIPLSNALRSSGFHASNLYWPLTRMFGSDDETKEADEFGRRIINLFVDLFVSPDQARRCADTLAALVESQRPEPFQASYARG
jgi:dTDP-4-amino-4,6-dideoxygalactose transaminase